MVSSEARYRMLVDAVSDYAIYMLDQQGVVVSWNMGAQRLKGYAEAEAIGLHFSRFYEPQDAADGMPMRALATALEHGRYEAEGWRVRKDGARFWAQVVMHPVWSPDHALLGYAKVTRDLSERRAAQAALQRSEEQFRLLVQAVTDYAIYMLDAQGIVTNWNPGAQRAKGYAPHEVIGTHFSRFYRAADRAQGLPARALATAAAQGRFEGEGWRVRKDGSEFWANVVIEPIHAGNGDLIGYAKVTRDITEKRNAQLALEQARESLFQSQKLEAIGQLTGGVAHDFNNLLMVVLTSLDMVRRRVAGDDKLVHLVDNAMQGAQRGVSLTQRMLAFARKQALRPEAVDLAALITGMADMMERTLGPTVDIRRRFPVGLPAVLVDAHQLELSILNLAVNARDAMPDGGSLVFAAHEVPGAETAAWSPGRFVQFTVTDSGCGMDAATLARAAEPFFTTKEVGKGTGLGLGMVQGLAAQSGGKFALTSAPGRGTTVSLWLPVALDGPAARPEPPRDATQVQGDAAALKILAVDDDPLVLAGTCSMLEDLGHAVVAASSAHEALELVRSEPGIDLVITDLAMPRMTGWQLLEVLHRDHPSLGTILASGYLDLPKDATGVHRLAKPYDQPQLVEAIARAMGWGSAG